MPYISDDRAYWQIKDLEDENRRLKSKIDDLRRWIDQTNKNSITYLQIKLIGKKQIYNIPIKFLRLIQNNTVLYYEQPKQKSGKGDTISLAKVEAWVVIGSNPIILPGFLV